MRVHYSIMLALIFQLVNFGSISSSVQLPSQTADQFGKLFSSIANHNVTKSKVYHEMLVHEVANEQKAFDALKEELQIAQNRNAYRKRSLYKKNNFIPINKRETNENDLKTSSCIVPLTAEKTLPPLNTASFRWMIEHNKIIVDKTKYLNLMLESEDRYFFLSRPRRFGKSLLVDIMNEFFNGEKKLFENTYIYSECPAYSWLKYPVIRIDFTAGISLVSVAEFRMSLVSVLQSIGKSHDIALKSTILEVVLKELIEGLKDKTGLEVVVLLDEYDAPYAAHYGEPESAGMLKALQSFFRALKGHSSYIHFLFFTGVSTVAVSDYWTFVVATDLSLMPEYAAILGFTEEDLDTYFERAVQNVTKEQKKSRDDIRQEMRLLYDGYKFAGTGKQIYNPCSVIKYLNTKGHEKLFWRETGGLSTLLKNKFLEFPQIAYNYVVQHATRHKSSCPVNENLSNKPKDVPPLKIKKSTLSGRVDTAEKSVAALQAVLFHGGYLTIDKEECEGYETIYYLRFSNLEVECDYVQHLSQALLVKANSEYQTKITMMGGALQSYDWNEFISIMKSLLAEVPYFMLPSKMGKTGPKNSEAMFQFLLYILMFQADFNAQMEVPTNLGRADLVVKTKSAVFIFETKLQENEVENPLDQCFEKYVPKYKHYEQVIFCIGLKFSQKAEIVAWGVAEILNNGELVNQDGEIKFSSHLVLTSTLAYSETS